MADVEQVCGEVQVEERWHAELAVDLLDLVLRDDAFFEGGRQVRESSDVVLGELEGLEVGEGEDVSVDFGDACGGEV